MAAGQNPVPIAPKQLGEAVDPDPTNKYTLPIARPPRKEQNVFNFSDGAQALDFRGPPNPAKPIQRDTVDRSHVPEPKERQWPNETNGQREFNAFIKGERLGEPLVTPAQKISLDTSSGPPTLLMQYAELLPYDSKGELSAGAPFYQPCEAKSAWQPPASSSASAGRAVPAPSPAAFHTEPTYAQQLNTTQKNFAGYGQSQPPQVRLYAPHESELQRGQQDLFGMPHTTRWEDEEDPFDVSDNEDVVMGEYDASGVWQGGVQDDHLRKNDLGIVVALQANQDSRGLSVRSFTSFIDRPNMLSAYIPSSQSTPLRDPMTARIFCHFVNVTGPSMSMFERHPANPSLIFQGKPVPKSQQHIWTCMFS